MTMNLRNLKAARLEAVRFINRCEDVEKELKEYHAEHNIKVTDLSSHFGSAKSGALRRTSMELTRALAELRR